MTFSKNYQAKMKIAEITGNNIIEQTNEGFLVLFTSEEKEAAKVAAAKLIEAGFSNVSLCGRGKFYIAVNHVSVEKQNFQIASVTF
jgi:hypothetical protein